MFLEEALESEGFYLLGGGAVLAEVIGFIVAKKAGLAAFPVWQFLLLLIGTVIAAAVISTKN